MSESWREIVIQKIWDQWVSIGGSGAAKPRPNQEPVDPEALVLVTTSLGMEEPRLAEMCFDWLSKNGKLISVQRLKNIQRPTHLGDEGWLRELAELMIERKFVSWKSIANSVSDPLTVKESRQFSVRSMSQKPLSISAESFIFKLRNFFGMTARAEVFHWLLTHESGHASAIARDTFWLPKTVQNILNEWENAGICRYFICGAETLFQANVQDIDLEDEAEKRRFVK